MVNIRRIFPMAATSLVQGWCKWAFVLLYGATALPLFVAADPVAAGTADLVNIVLTVVLAASLIALSLHDLATYRLPNAATLPLTAAGFALAIVDGRIPVWESVVGALIGYGLLSSLAAGYRRLRGRDGLGLGDAKLTAAAGAWLGYASIPAVLLIASVSALIVISASMARGALITAQTRLAFGPFLALGFWLTWLYGARFIE
jgi:leader peptidase (prepilin peptidase) / N-methyltransferase